MSRKIIGVTVGTPLSPTVIKEKINDAGYATKEHVQENYQPKGNYLGAAELPNAVNTALAQAKASGEFDGEDGYTPIKGVDYFDGARGRDGSDGYTPVKGVDYVDGKDGVSPSVNVNSIEGGHRVSVTDANGTKSFDVMDGVGGSGGANIHVGPNAPTDGSNVWIDTDEEEPGGTGGGAQADWNASEGEPGHVLNRTHWAKTVVEDPTFNGDMTGRVNMDVSSIFGSEAYIVKVSSRYISIDDMVNAKMVFNMSGTDIEQTLTANSVFDATYVLGVFGTLVILNDSMVVLSVPNDSEIMGTVLPAGTWFAYAPGYLYVKSLSCLTPAEVETVQKLDEKFLPDSALTKADRTHWTDKDGTVHQIDRKYIPAEWMAALVKKDGVFVPATTIAGDYNWIDITSLCLFPVNTLDTATSATVVFNGTAYDCKPFARGEELWIGNETTWDGSGENTGEPFVIAANPTRSKLEIVTDMDHSESDFTLSITLHDAMMPDRIPEKYLPESVKSVILRSSTAGSSKLFKLTVDDTGTITATEVTA